MKAFQAFMKRFQATQTVKLSELINFYCPWSSVGFLMIAGEIEINQFAQIRLLVVKFLDDPEKSPK